MPAWIPAAIAAVGAIGSAVSQSSAAGKAANAQTQAAKDASKVQWDIYQQNRQDFAPYRTVGTGALNQLAALYGLPQYQAAGSPGGAQPLSYAEWAKQNGTPFNYFGGGGIGAGLANYMGGQNGYQDYLKNFNAAPATAAVPDYSTFYNSPDYNFARTEGQRGVEQSSAARGGAASGNALKALAQFNQSLASQQYGNYFNRLANIAGIGQSATNSVAGAGQNYANMYGQNALYAGDARASGIVGKGNAWSSFFQGLGSMAGGMGGGMGGGGWNFG